MATTTVLCDHGITEGTQTPSGVHCSGPHVYAPAGDGETKCAEAEAVVQAPRVLCLHMKLMYACQLPSPPAAGASVRPPPEARTNTNTGYSSVCVCVCVCVCV